MEQHFEMLASSFAKLVLSKKEYLSSLAQALAENKIFCRQILEDLEHSLKRTMLRRIDKLWEVKASSATDSVKCQKKRPKDQRSPAGSDKPVLAISNVNNIFFPAASDERKSRSLVRSLKQARDEAKTRSKQKKPNRKALVPFTKIRKKRKIFKRNSISKRKRIKGSSYNFRNSWRHDSFNNHVSDHWIETSSERSEDYSDKYSDVLTNDTEDERNKTKILRQCSELGSRRGCNFTQGRGLQFREKIGNEVKSDATKEFVHLVPLKLKRREKKELVNLVPQRSKRSGQMMEDSTMTANCKPGRCVSDGPPESIQKLKETAMKKRYQIIVKMKEYKNGKVVVLGIKKQPPPQCAQLLLCLDRLTRPAAFGLERKPMKAATGEYWLKHIPELCNLRTKQSTYKVFQFYRKRYFSGKYVRQLNEE